MRFVRVQINKYRRATGAESIYVKFYENKRIIYRTRGSLGTYFERFVTTYLERYGKRVDEYHRIGSRYTRIDYVLSDEKYSELLEILKMIRPREWRLYKKLLGCLEGSKKCDNLARDAAVEKIAETI